MNSFKFELGRLFLNDADRFISLIQADEKYCLDLTHRRRVD